MSKWIIFVEGEPKPKTKTWHVVTKEDGGKPGFEEGGNELGEVRWYGPWRCYAFFPAGGTLFEKDCLRDIADFCEQRSKAHRARIRI